MSENAPRNHEAVTDHEMHERVEHRGREKRQAHHEAHEARHAENQAELAAKAREAAAENALNQENVIDQMSEAEETPQTFTPKTINSHLKKLTLNRELKSIRRKLPKNERMLSGFVHQPVVRVVSEAASKTVTRPSGMLGGGIVAFLGSTGYLYLAKHIGFTYNYFVFLLLFVGGFVVGLVLELLVYMATSSRRRSHD